MRLFQKSFGIWNLEFALFDTEKKIVFSALLLPKSAKHWNVLNSHHSQCSHRCASTGVSVFDICAAYVANAMDSHKILILKIIVKNKRAQMMHIGYTHENYVATLFIPPQSAACITKKKILNRKKPERRIAKQEKKHWINLFPLF